jgi:hypothetical protein
LCDKKTVAITRGIFLNIINFGSPGIPVVATRYSFLILPKPLDFGQKKIISEYYKLILTVCFDNVVKRSQAESWQNHERTPLFKSKDCGIIEIAAQSEAQNG